MEKRESVWLVLVFPDFDPCSNRVRWGEVVKATRAALAQGGTSEPVSVNARGDTAPFLVTGDLERITAALRSHLSDDARWLVVQPGTSYAEFGLGTAAGWLGSRTGAHQTRQQ